MKILITGGAGFIGSHIIEELYKGNNITILDNLSGGRLSNIEHIKNINFVKGDVLNLDLVKKLIKDTDIVIHLATSFAHLKSVEKPIFDMENNIRGTLNLLVASRDSNVKKFIYGSSSAVYGNNQEFQRHSRNAPSGQARLIQPEIAQTGNPGSPAPPAGCRGTY